MEILMPTLQWNQTVWKKSYTWDAEGEEWSACWGNSIAQWFGSIFPRIHSFLPCQHILEIAPGFGRWTKFLLQHCESYSGVDISEKCIDACRLKFDDYSCKTNFYNGDGKSLNFIDDSSVDFCFSFDSLVHVDINTLESYIIHLLKKLTKK